MLIGGDVLFNVLPSVAWSSGVMELLTRPLRASAGLGARLALAPARAALEGVLGSGRAGGLLEGALGGLAPALGRLQSPGAIVDATVSATVGTAGGWAGLALCLVELQVQVSLCGVVLCRQTSSLLLLRPAALPQLRLLTSGGPDVELRAMPLGKAVGQARPAARQECLSLVPGCRPANCTAPALHA